MSQKAEANDSSTVIQVTGNFHQGISLTDCERLFNLLFTENFPKLEAVAAAKAKENVDILVKSTFEKIEKKIDQVSAEKLAQPDVQATFNTAVQGAAKKGNKTDIDLLAELLESRVEKLNNNYLDNCIEAAVEMVPKLTNEMLSLLPALHFIQTLAYNAPAELDAAFEAINERFLSKCHEITPSMLKTMASIGVGSYINITGNNTYSEMKKTRYPHLNDSDADHHHPKMISALKLYDTKSFHQLTLTTPGQVIAIKMLSRVFTSIDLRSCLN